MTDFDRAGKARALLNDPILQEAFQTVEKTIHETWASLDTRKRRWKDEAHELRLMLAALKNVRKSIEAVAREGKTELHRNKQPTFLGDLWKSKSK